MRVGKISDDALPLLCNELWRLENFITDTAINNSRASHNQYR